MVTPGFEKAFARASGLSTPANPGLNEHYAPDHGRKVLTNRLSLATRPRSMADRRLPSTHAAPRTATMSGAIQRRDAIDRQSSPPASATGLPEPRGPRNPTLVELDRPSLVPGVHQYADDAISADRLFQNGLWIRRQSALPVGIDHGNPRRAVVDVKPSPHCSPGPLPVNVGSGKAQLAKRNAGPRLRGRDWTMGAQPVRELSEGHADRRCRRSHRVDVAPD